MKWNLIFIAFLMIALPGCAGNTQSNKTNEQIVNTEIFDSKSYRLDSGDRIQIKVFNEDDLSLELLIGDTGNFSYPHLKEVKLRGLTVNEIEVLITEGLKGDYLKDPTVQVSITEYRPFFINGEVSNVGAYPYQPGLNVSKAIALAGGLTERASEKGIYVIRENDSTQSKIKVSFKTTIFPGDILTIDESFF